VPDRTSLWRQRARSLRKARKALRAEEPDGIHDVRVELRRVTALAFALKKRRIARRAKRLVRGLSGPRSLEVNRQLLARVSALGLLSPQIAAGLDARWDNRLAADRKRVARAADGNRIRRLQRLLARLARREDAAEEARGLLKERRRAEQQLASPPDGREEDALHRYRLAVKRARYLAEALAALGLASFEEKIEREKTLQETLGRWNDIRVFRESLLDARREGEKTGSVGLVAELDHLLTVLEGTLADARRRAVVAARGMSNVVPLEVVHSSQLSVVSSQN
jgi:CHAD domain-containing protein